MLSIYDELQKELAEENLNTYETNLLKFNIGDERLNNRAVRIQELFEANPGSSILQTTKEWKEAKAAYRFFDNKKVTVEALLEPHIQATFNILKNKRVVFAIQDTSTIDFSSRNVHGMGNQGNDFAKGFMFHPTLTVSPMGTPLGIIDFQCWTRKEEEEEEEPEKLTKNQKREANRKKKIEDKESVKWIKSLQATCEMQKKLNNETHFISMADREADIYELFKEREIFFGKEGFAPDLLVRARSDRNILNVDKKKKDYGNS